MAANPNPAARRRRAIQRGFRLARRVHLYFGLFLVPWVGLYGVTALLFNHPDWMHPRSMQAFGREVFADSPLAAPPELSALAAAVHAELPEGLTEPENIRWVGRYRLRGKSDASRYSVYAEPDGRSGVMYTTPNEAEGTHPLESMEPLSVPYALSRDQEWPTVEGHLDAEGLSLDRVPSLMFDVREGDTLWRIEYHPLKGAIEAEQVGERQAAPTARQLLLRLHTQHVYPGAVTVQWLWAWLVDLMGMAMVIWGFTGLLMWWQIKRLRRIGGIVILSGVGAMAVLGWSLYAAMGF
ncbi:MAG TPA: hypothetical protein DFR83_12015 [Deltaproteobacteria bacterium]|nr:hypothetical protein [Deltaproteobacteria bacterium]